ncbi:PDZ domain-containing protein [Enterobacteriaceae endosymbiont of Plateumaris consimilis]|uniref:trypsin-like peptidase domain-containing protein n=1 Tax=Enterobacteriaceae endosymbiont of Plateumaris consimilis TaxID=2675794 RepID=UPI0014499FBB|nr:trypsin-like peptidase domain-containing protein [Enterobacteriaceae endosymbiont of Plateumaris consimilis]QJC28611.1 PDZ domain-containing protein [Enterobacteriaceae endosymbiont of Plateumaris consimilis]
MKKLKLIIYFLFCIIISTPTLIKINATPIPPQKSLNNTLPSLSKMLDKVMPAVVRITVDSTIILHNVNLPLNLQQYIGEHPQYCQEGSILKGTLLCKGNDDAIMESNYNSLASGVIIDAKNGYIITNNHVIENATRIEVELSDGRSFEATLIGTDELLDIALIKIKNAKNLHLVGLKIANSDKLKVGDYTVAIGNPFGLGNTATTGIISALGRNGINSTKHFENFIQTDAAMNSGNSGGALLNLNGELIGINTAIVSPDGGNVGVGFAIPSNSIMILSHQLIKYGRIKHVSFGVVGIGVNKELARIMNAPVKYIDGGTFVGSVINNSTAYNGGVKAGDIIIALNGKKLHGFYSLRSLMSILPVGSKVELTVIRNSKIKHLILTLQEDKESKLYFTLKTSVIEGGVFKNIIITKGKKKFRYVKVTNISDGSFADDIGFETEDIIVDINKIRIHTIKDIKRIISSKKKLSILVIHILRDNSNMYLLTVVPRVVN